MEILGDSRHHRRMESWMRGVAIRRDAIHDSVRKAPPASAVKQTAGLAYRVSRTVNTVRTDQSRLSVLPGTGRWFSSSALATSASSSSRCTGLDAATYRSRRSSIA